MQRTRNGNPSTRSRRTCSNAGHQWLAPTLPDRANLRARRGHAHLQPNRPDYRRRHLSDIRGLGIHLGTRQVHRHRFLSRATRAGSHQHRWRRRRDCRRRSLRCSGGGGTLRWQGCARSQLRERGSLALREALFQQRPGTCVAPASQDSDGGGIPGDVGRRAHGQSTYHPQVHRANGAAILPAGHGHDQAGGGQPVEHDALSYARPAHGSVFLLQHAAGWCGVPYDGRAARNAAHRRAQRAGGHQPELVDS